MGLVIAPAAATAATVRSPASVVVATAAATTVRTVTAIVPPSAIRTTAPIHPISAAGSAVPLVAEQPIAPIAFGDLIANGLCGEAPLSEILSMPFYFTSQIRQLGWTKALPHALREIGERAVPLRERVGNERAVPEHFRGLELRAAGLGNQARLD